MVPGFEELQSKSLVTPLWETQSLPPTDSCRLACNYRNTGKAVTVSIPLNGLGRQTTKEPNWVFDLGVST